MNGPALHLVSPTVTISAIGVRLAFILIMLVAGGSSFAGWCPELSNYKLLLVLHVMGLLIITQLSELTK